MSFLNDANKSGRRSATARLVGDQVICNMLYDRGFELDVLRLQHHIIMRLF